MQRSCIPVEQLKEWTPILNHQIDIQNDVRNLRTRLYIPPCSFLFSKKSQAQPAFVPQNHLCDLLLLLLLLLYVRRKLYNKVGIPETNFHHSLRNQISSITSTTMACEANKKFNFFSSTDIRKTFNPLKLKVENSAADSILNLISIRIIGRMRTKGYEKQKQIKGECGLQFREVPISLPIKN